MRIAIDYTAAASHWPGVGRYGRELVRALVLRPDCPELVLFEHGGAQPLPIAALGLDAAPAGLVERVRLPGSRRLMKLRSAVGFGGLERRLGNVDLVHRAFIDMPPLRGLDYLAPLLEFGLRDAKRDAALARSLAPAKRVVVGSTAGRIEAVERLSPYGFEAFRARSFTTGADHWLRAAKPRTALENLAAGAPRFLVLGAVGSARRPLQILAGFEALVASLPPDEAPVLHFDGRAGDAADAFKAALAASPARARVTWNPKPDEAALPELVAGSTTLVHLSRGELSPITALEALHFGVSVVASHLPAFEEALGDEVLVTPEAEVDAEALGAAMARGLRAGLDEEARRVRQGVVAGHTWDVCAADHIAIWREAHEDPDLDRA